MVDGSWLKTRSARRFCRAFFCLTNHFENNSLSVQRKIFMEAELEKFRDYLSVIVNNKNMSFNRMTQNFTWAFGIFTAIIIVLIRIENFESNIFAWFLLNLSLYFWAIFFIRSCKEYVNQIRFVGLEKRCLSYIFNMKMENGSIFNGKDILEKIREYHLSWYSPIRKNKVIHKVLFPHGFLALLVPIFFLWIYVLVHMDRNNRGVYFFIILPVMGLYHLIHSFKERYFQCRVEEESMKGLE